MNLDPMAAGNLLPGRPGLVFYCQIPNNPTAPWIEPPGAGNGFLAKVPRKLESVGAGEA